MSKEKLTYERLHEVLDYDLDTGFLVWIKPNSNRVKVGDIAGSKSHGYINVTVDGKKYRAHRLAWFFVKGYFPENDIDHIDRVRYHNWIDNLREASLSCNMRNTGNPKNNTSKIKGVSWNKALNKWSSQIKIYSKKKHLGYYKHFHNAVCARLAGEQACNWSNCDSSSPAYQYVQNMLEEK